MFSNPMQQGMFIGGQSIPSDIKSLVTATGGLITTLVGPNVIYSAAEGQVPNGLGGVQASTSAPVHGAGYYGGPAYSNVLIDIAQSWAGATDVVVTGEQIRPTLATNTPSASYLARGTTHGTNPVLSFDLKADGCRYAIIVLETFGSGKYAIYDLQDGIVATAPTAGGCTADIIPLSDGYYRCTLFSTFASGTNLTGITGSIANNLITQYGATNIGILAKNPMCCSQYLFPYIPPDQSVVSTVGTTTGNGVSVPLTGSDAATALKQCFEGPNGNDAVGTVAVLVKMGIASSEISNSIYHSIFTPADSVTGKSLSIGRGSTGTPYIGRVDDGTANVAAISTEWDRGDFFIIAYEYGGGRLRIGRLRFNSSGVQLEGSYTWSHATLAGGVPFDGSFNPTTFLRWFLNSTVPNWMRCHFVSNQHSLGDTEIIRRLRKYGQF